MSTDEADRTVRRILLALDTAQDAGALELAAELAALLQGTLQGVFVENADLLRLARLPFTYEISLGSAAARRLETVQLERDLRAQAERMRRLLENHALRHSVEWSFRIERGALTSVLAGGGADIIILSRSGSGARTRHGTVLIAYDGSPAAGRALDTAADLAGNPDELLVLLPTTQTAQLRPAAAARLAARGRRAIYAALPDLTPQQLIAAGQRHHCRLLVVGGDPATLLPLLPELQQSSCPVAVVQ